MTDEEIDIFLKELGSEMREARTQRAVTQRELAALVGTAQTQICYLEQGTTDAKISSILRYYDGLDMDVLVIGLKRKRA